MAFLGGACGGGGSGGTPTDKAGWDKRNGATIAAVNTDVDAANAALAKGDRPAILSSCNQLQADVADARKGLPVPDAAADSALRAALDAMTGAVPTCLNGGRVANEARVVEQAQREMKTARAKMDDAATTIAAWQ